MTTFRRRTRRIKRVISAVYPGFSEQTTRGLLGNGPYCNFCGRLASSVDMLVASPHKEKHRVHICDDCILVSVQIITNTEKLTPEVRMEITQDVIRDLPVKLVDYLNVNLWPVSVGIE